MAGGWNWDRPNLFEGDARVMDPVEPDPSGDLPDLHPPIKERAGAPEEQPYVELYKISEADIFNLGAAWSGTGVAPYRYLDVTNGSGAILGNKDPRTAAWWVIYLDEVLREDRRPKVWLDRAATKMRELADFLLTYQLGSPTEDSALSSSLGATATTDTEYGGFATVGDSATAILASVYSEDVGAGGLALLRAYQRFGDKKYQAGYRAALKCLRRMQCGDLLTTRHATTTSGGTARYHSGMWTHKLDVGATGSFIMLNAPRHGWNAITGAVIRPNEQEVGAITVDLRNTGGTNISFKFNGYFNSDNIGANVTWNFRLLPIGDAFSAGTTPITTITEAGDGTNKHLSINAETTNPLSLCRLSVSYKSSDGATYVAFAIIRSWTCTLRCH